MFNRVRILTFAALICLIAHPVFATGQQVMGMEREELLLRLRSGDYEFLHNTPSPGESPKLLREIARLGDEALYMLGLIYAELNLPVTSERLLTEAWNTSGEPWRHEALTALLEAAADEERYADLEALAREGRARYPDDPQVLASLLRALYRQEKDAEVVELVDELDRLLSAGHAGARLSETDAAENALWRAVSASRLDLSGWEKLYVRLYADFPAGSVHTRVWLYLRSHPEVADRFSSDQLLFFEATHLLAVGQPVGAVEIYWRLADAASDPSRGGAPGSDDSPGNLILSAAGLRNMYVAGSTSGRQSATAARLTALAEGALERDHPDASADDGGESAVAKNFAARAYEYAGRLFRTAGNFEEAVRTLSRSLDIQATGDEAKRTRWYLLSSRVRGNPARTATELAGIVRDLDDPGYHDDLFLDLATQLTDLEDWDALFAAYNGLEHFATAGTRAMYQLLIAEALRAGWTPAWADPADALRDGLLRQASSQTGNLYAAFVASALLGESGTEVISAAAGAERGAVSPDPMPDGATTAARLLNGYLSYGLLDRAIAVAHAQPVGDALLESLCDALTRQGRIRDSIQIARRMASAPEKLIYPRGYSAAFTEVLNGESIDPWIVYALAREESLFDPEITSAAGAVGMLQLLPATAEDVARRMRIDKPVLTDPVGNIRIGARYLSMLVEQFGGVIKALAAYNAGQGRVRSWEREWPALTGVLFHQAIPYPETYFHIRNIVVSAVYYGYLYADRTPSDTIRLMFGGFQD